MYEPKPENIENDIVPPELFALTELMASNVHDVWASQRIAEGWTYGTEKDPVKKTTPLLVPYAELPESEKDYDRNTALATIRMIIRLGYTISKSS